MMQRLLALAVGLIMTAMVGGWGYEQPPAPVEQSQAARAVRALTSDAPGAAGRLPADFATVMGYRPEITAAGPTRADGGCSSPFGGTRYHFTDVCRRHDLGYDLLRYADAKGQPLGPWARKAVDERFARQIGAGCEGPGCRVAADLYTGVIEFNSWRQGYGTPVVEPVSRIVLTAGVGLGAALLLGLLPVPRRPALPGEPVPAGRPARARRTSRVH